MSLAEARIVRQQFLKSFSSTDTRLVPASGVTVIVHRQGATIAGGGHDAPHAATPRLGA